jgi:hypothetical protein
MALGRRSHAGVPTDDHGRTPAQWYCLLAGAALLLAGIFGFISDASFETGNAPDGSTDGGRFLGFEVNGWHNIVHLASGLLLLAAANTRPTARTIAIAFGAVYGLVAVIGLLDGSDVLGIIPVNGADNLLHIALSALGIVAGLMSKPRRHAGRSGRQSQFDSQTSTGRFDREPDAARELGRTAGDDGVGSTWGDARAR